MDRGQPIHLETCPPVYTTVSRVVPRHVCCEHCGANFIYEMTRMGYGEAPGVLVNGQLAASPLAVERALADLAKELAAGAEAVPCPQCLKYQRHMTAAARKVQWGWVRHIGGQALVAMPVVAFLAVLVAVIVFPGNTELALYVAGGTAVLFLAAGLVTGVAYWLTPCNPNGWSESYRRARAAELACTREVFALASLNGGPFAEDLTYGREKEYEGVLFLWVLPEEIVEEAVVPLVTADGREVDVELSTDDHDGVFLDEDRVDDPDDPDGKREYRICLRVFDVYRPQPTPAEAERS
jgi:hypothetical protein